MDKYKKYYGLIIIAVALGVVFFAGLNLIKPQYQKLQKVKSDIIKQQKIFEEKKKEKNIVESKLKQKLDTLSKGQKKIYSPIESDLGNDSLFFTLYNDVIDMIHTNSVKIKSMDYVYNPESDPFVVYGKDIYFVCDINMELVSNFVNLGKLIQNIYQYPYYLKINNLKVSPYKNDKKILLTSMSLRLYAYTEPMDEAEARVKLAKKNKAAKSSASTKNKAKSTKTKSSKTKK